MHLQRNRRIAFVVDDEKIIASTAALILSHNGFDARPFFDPIDALRAMQSDSPDLLVTDVIMPNMSGIQLALQMREFCPACKVLLSSGQSMTTELLAKAAEQGHYFEIVAKPVHPKALLEKIMELFGEASSLRYAGLPPLLGKCDPN